MNFNDFEIDVKKINSDNPFRYVVIDNLFADIDKLCNFYKRNIEKDISIKSKKHKNQCIYRNLDPYQIDNPFKFFYSIEMFDFISDIFNDIEFTKNIFAEIHNRSNNSPSKHIHNDFEKTFANGEVYV